MEVGVTTAIGTYKYECTSMGSTVAQPVMAIW